MKNFLDILIIALQGFLFGVFCSGIVFVVFHFVIKYW